MVEEEREVHSPHMQRPCGRREHGWDSQQDYVGLKSSEQGTGEAGDSKCPGFRSPS